MDWLECKASSEGYRSRTVLIVRTLEIVFGDAKSNFNGGNIEELCHLSRSPAWRIRDHMSMGGNVVSITVNMT